MYLYSKLHSCNLNYTCACAHARVHVVTLSLSLSLSLSLNNLDSIEYFYVLLLETNAETLDWIEKSLYICVLAHIPLHVRLLGFYLVYPYIFPPLYLGPITTMKALLICMCTCLLCGKWDKKQAYGNALP